MQRDILKFQANMPVTVQLDKGPEGKEVQGRYGLEYQYTCNGNSTVMWLPPQGRAALLRAGAQAGDIVEISKTFRGEAAIFDVRLLSNATGPTNAQAPAGPRLHVNGKTYDMGTNGHSQAAPPANDAPTPQPAARATAPAIGPTGKHLALCLCAAIDAVAEAQEYAHQKGLGITFLGSDIRAIANSIYINDQNGNRS